MDSGNLLKGNAVIMTVAFILGIVGFAGVVTTNEALEHTSFAAQDATILGTKYMYRFGFRGWYEVENETESAYPDGACKDDEDANVGLGVIAFLALLIGWLIALGRACCSCGTTSKMVGVILFLLTFFSTLFAIAAFGNYWNGCFAFIEGDWTDLLKAIGASSVDDAVVGTGGACWIVTFLLLIISTGLTGYEVFSVTDFESSPGLTK